MYAKNVMYYSLKRDNSRHYTNPVITNLYLLLYNGTRVMKIEKWSLEAHFCKINSNS